MTRPNPTQAQLSDVSGQVPAASNATVTIIPDVGSGNGRAPDAHYQQETGSAEPSNPIATAYVDFAAKKRRDSAASDHSGASTVVSPPTTISADRKGSSPSLAGDSSNGSVSSRKSSVPSISFRQPATPGLPQGHQRDKRFRSPHPHRFRHHVSFDNIPVGESTKSNTLGFTVNLTHHGYQPQRRSRTLMVGVDQHSYSDFALQWLLEEFADDGDEIICVHVTDKDPRSVEEKNYKALVYKMVDNVKAKIPEHCAISIVFEYAVGKLHASFQNLIHIYQPSMLVVGTRGRSLGGIQGLVNTNSFSKYCLQYSPIPTVVVRDNEKRMRKKEKREKDPGRRSYISMLAQGKHEADSETSSVYDMETRLSPDEEAHRVAAAIGLPAQFDPTLKPINLEALMHGGRRASGSPTASPATSAPASPKVRAVDVTQVGRVTAQESDSDDSSDDDGGFEVMSGQQALKKDQAIPRVQKDKLHRMEMNEGAALKLNKVEDEDSP